MSPALRNVILNGASRHRLSKGFLLLQQDGQHVMPGIRQKFIDRANRYLLKQESLIGFTVAARFGSDCVIGLATPFLPVYTPSERDSFINKLHFGISILLQIADHDHLLLAPAGVNPFAQDSIPPALCADIHQIEVFDNGEIERIYNLYRQFLAELLAISVHSAVFGSATQNEFSLRMRVNPSSFLPRYLSEFSIEHLDKIKSMLRRKHGLADLTQMDINPIAGDSNKLMILNSAILTPSPAAVELRFVDSQTSYPFIRAQIIVFQAIAVYGRYLARLGKRLPFLDDKILDENKALTIRNGAGAILVPDLEFGIGKEKETKEKEGYSYHDKRKPERATTALLMIIKGVLIPALRDMQCEFHEIAPIIIGAELRKNGRQCFANYAEYQKFLQFEQTTSFYQQSRKMLDDPTLDPITKYNRGNYKEFVNNIEKSWDKKLKYNKQKQLLRKTKENESKSLSNIVECILDLRLFSQVDDIAQKVEDLWQSTGVELVGKTIRTGDSLTWEFSGGRVSLWIANANGISTFTEDTEIQIMDVLRSPKLVYHCKVCNEYGPLRCAKCVEDRQDTRLCSTHAYILKDELRAYCPDHIPTCNCRKGCQEKATFHCHGCGKLFGQHFHHVHPNDPNIDYCDRCYRWKFELCQVAKCGRLGRSKCQYQTRNMAAPCNTPSCSDHSYQWKIWGPHNPGITLCEHHKHALRSIDPADLIFLIITAQPPSHRYEQRFFMPNPFRLRRMLNRVLATQLTFHQVEAILKSLERAVPNWGKNAERNYGFITKTFSETLMNLDKLETSFLNKIRAFYKNRIGWSVSGQIQGLHIEDKYSIPDQIPIYKIRLVAIGSKDRLLDKKVLNELKNSLHFEVESD